MLLYRMLGWGIELYCVDIDDGDDEDLVPPRPITIDNQRPYSRRASCLFQIDSLAIPRLEDHREGNMAVLERDNM